MLYQKMRPRRFDDVVGQNVIVENLRSQSKRNSWFQVIILYGQFGSGKTTIGRIVRDAANCKNKDANGNPCLKCIDCEAGQSNGIDFKEIDGASNTGVDNIRDLIEWMSYKPIGRYKVVIIDEVHMLSTSAFNSLLKLLEEPPSYAIIILATTDIDSIPLTVQSRSACYAFGQIPENLIADHVQHVAKANQIAIEENACTLIAKYSHGAMRNALMLLEQLGASGDIITESICREIIGISQEESVFNLLEAVMQTDISAFLTGVRNFAQVGKNLAVLTDELLSACSDLIVASAGNPKEVCGTSCYKKCVVSLAAKYSTSQLCCLSEKVMLLRQAMRENASQDGFIANGVSLIQQLRNSNSVVEERLQALNTEVTKLQEQINMGTCVDAKGKDGVIMNSKYVQCSSDGIPATSVELDEQKEMGVLYDSIKSPDTTVKGVQNEAANVYQDESFQMYNSVNSDDTLAEENFFDDGLMADIMEQNDVFYEKFSNPNLENRPHNCSETTADKETVSESIPAPTCVDTRLSPAAEAEAQLLRLCEDNPEVRAHVVVGCRKEYRENGLVLVTPEQSVCNMLLLYINRSEIRNITVECRN